MFIFCSVLCFKTTDSLISANAKVYIIPYKCKCVMIANTVIPRLTSDPANEFFG